MPPPPLPDPQRFQLTPALQGRHVVRPTRDLLWEAIKTAKASEKIKKRWKNVARVKLIHIDYAWERKVVDIKVGPAYVGSVAAGDINLLVFKCYQFAVKSLPETFNRNDFKFHVKLTVDTNVERQVHIATTTYSRDNHAKWYVDMLDKVAARFASNKGASFKSFVMAFHFVELPKPGGGRTGPGSLGTESRDLDSIYKKKSVLRIKNSDQSCFWRAIAILFYKGDTSLDQKQLKDCRKTLQTTMAKHLCEGVCGLPWNNGDCPVSLEQLPDIEEKLGFSILVLNIHELPILGKTGYIYDSLLYKSDCVQGDKQMWLLYDDGHYNVISDIKAFLAVREFCHRCMKCFKNDHNDKEQLAKHECAAAASGLTDRPQHHEVGK